MTTKTTVDDRQQQQTTTLRPTEAQLRWAQFHRKERAQRVQEKLNRLYQTPASPSEVPNAIFPDDGITTDASNNSSNDDGNSPTTRRRMTREKPKISRGRRAMLRVSKRQYESRRLHIQQHGFQRSDDKENDDVEDQDEEEAIIAMFADESVLKKHRKRRASRRHRPEDDEQRVQRFEAAYHAMMMNLMPQEQPDIKTPAKGRWTRASHVPVAVSIDGRQYDDLKWGFTGRKATPLKQSATPSTAPFDRRASWLVHVPARQSTSRRLSFAPAMSPDGQFLEPENAQHHGDALDGQPSFFSPGQMKFDELVARLRRREAELQKGKEGTPLRQKEAQGKAAKFREKYSRRHSSEGLSPNTDFLARDMYGFPYVEESPGGQSLDSLSEGGFSFGDESEFWRSARQMHDTVPAPNHGSQHDVSNSLQRQSAGGQHSEARVRGTEASPSAKESEVLSSPESDSEFWRNTREMHATSPSLERQKQVDSVQTEKSEDQFDHGRDYIVKLRVRAMMDSVDSPSEDSPSVQKLPHDKLVPFTDGTAEGHSPLDGARASMSEEDSLVRRRVRDISSPSDSLYGDSPSSVGVSKLPHGKLKAFEENRNVSPTEGKRTQSSDSMVKRRVLDMNRSPESVGQASSRSADISRLPNEKLQPFEESADESPAQSKEARLQSSDSLVRRRIKEMDSPSESIDHESPSDFPSRAQRIDLVGPYKEAACESAHVVDGTSIATGAMIGGKNKSSRGYDDVHGVTSLSTAPTENPDSTALFDDSGVQLGERVSAGSPDLHPENARPSKEEPSSTSLYDDSGQQAGERVSTTSRDLYPETSVPSTEESDSTALYDDSGRQVGEKVSIASQALQPESTSTSKQSRSTAKQSHSIDSDVVPNQDHSLKSDAEIQQTPHKGALAASAALRVGTKVGGMFNRVFGGNKEVDSDELNAVASFRKTQGSKRMTHDDATSASSYRLLPDGIRRVVKNFSTKELREEQEDEYGAFDCASQSRSNSTSGDGGPVGGQRTMEDSEMIGDMDAGGTIIDTDGTTSDVTYDPRMDPKLAASLFLSPEILSKRLHQAIRAIERHNWEQVSYLLSANPWLAEMTDVTTGQYLLHKLALYGAGVAVFDETGGVVHVEAPAAPEDLSLNLTRMFPASVYKFDQDGNLPLHMAAVSGNQEMCRLLGERFASGASVRNEEGLLPLHMAIQSCSSPAPSADGTITSPSEIVRTVLGFFPAAVAVVDNDGNLPIHSAAGALRGDIGVEIIYMLLDEADKQVEENGLLFRCTEMKTLDDDSVTIATDITGTPTDSSAVDDSAYCNLVRNDMGHTALMVAIRSRSGWEIVEALACGPGGRKGALMLDANMSNALHLLVSADFADPASILSILKIAPEAAAVQNGEGMLPIEIACRQRMPQEAILALVLVDLPIDLDEKAGIKVREGFGGSWCFLTCECDDHYADVVEEVISICSYPQVRELCFANCGPHESGGPVIARATPRCRLSLRKALRFVGRFEFLGSAALHTDVSLGLKVFEALDFGTDDEYIEDGRRVLLRCYSREKSYLEETSIVRECRLDPSYVEEMFMFGVQESTDESQPDGDAHPQQFCVAIELPSLTLDRVVGGMLKNDEFHRNPDMRTRYFSKVCVVLRLVAKALRHLHEAGVVHGDVCLQNCGKFDDDWKLSSLIGMQRMGKRFSSSRMGESSPPEVVELLRNVVETRGLEASSRHVTFKGDIVAETSIDVWAFGKLIFEVLTGETLIEFDPEKEARHDNRALLTLANWNDEELRECIDVMKDSGVSTLGIDLVSHCLLPDPSDRPGSMDEILEHPFWKDMRRKTVMASRSRQQELMKHQGEKSEI